MSQNQDQSGQGIKIEAVNTEGLKKAGKHVDRSGSAKFSWKTIILVVILVAGMAAVILKGIPAYRDNFVVPDIPFTMSDAMDQNKGTTFLDEVLEQQAKNISEGEKSLLDEVKQLELYLNMINELNNLNLKSYTETVIEAEQNDNFDKNLKEKYARFLEILNIKGFKKDVLSPESLELHTLAAELNGYKKAIESKITTDGYRIVAEAGILAVKTEVVDASNLSYMNIDNLKIPASMEPNNYQIIYTDPTTQKEYIIKVPANSIVHPLIDAVYHAQASQNKTVGDGEEPDTISIEQIVKDLNDALNKIRVSLYASHTNDGVLKPNEGYNDIREKVDIPSAGETTVGQK